MAESKDDALIIPGKWEIAYNYSAGVTVSKFLKTLSEEARIIATKCSHCGLVMLPPRSYCERCFEPAEEWVEVGCEGTIEAATIVYTLFEGLPKPPYVIAFVMLDGADTAMVNFVDGVDLTMPSEDAARQVQIGTRVKVSFKGQREGRITDFRYHVLDGV